MKKEMHLICNAHIDPIWQWDLPEGISATLSTFYSAVKLAEKFDYVFCHNEVTVYKYVETYAPDLFVKIQELVKQGKWHIMGGWYLQPDCNMPSGESFVRQIREGQRYFKEKFGVCPRVTTNFDPFGHTVGLVQILKKCGMDGYLFMRPFRRELTLPSEQFVWRGLDGSEIKAVRVCSYNTVLGASVAAIKWQAEEQNVPVGAVLWGVGNHGGGPSAKDLKDIQEQLLTSAEVDYKHSTPEAFFAKIAPTNVVDTSLHISMPGCYTSMYRMKKMHAQLERELYLAEKLATVAYAKGMLEEYPQAQLRTAVEDLLNAEFHDVLPGSSVQCGEDAGLRLLNHGILEAERVKLKAFFVLSAEEEVARDGEYPIVVFNPHPYAWTENVECEFMLAAANYDENIVSCFSLYDEQGNAVPYQVIKEESNLNLDWRKRIVFTAQLQPLALSRYRLYVDFKKREEAQTRKDVFVFDNGRKYVRINAETGVLESYRVDGVEYVGDGFGLVGFVDNADPWGMAVNQLVRLGTKERQFSLSAQPTGVFRGMKSVQVIEDGEIYLGIEAFFEQDCTRARILYKIYKNNDDVDVDVTLYLGDIDKIIKLRIPVSMQGKLIGQTAFGTEDLFMDARENVAQRFVAMDDGERCFGVLNQGVYGSHYENSSVYMSLTRGVTYCAHPIRDRQLIPTDRFTKKIDQGEHNYAFRLTPTKREKLERRAQEFDMRPFALNIFPVPQKVAEIRDFSVELGDETTALTAMKKLDNAEGVLFRLLNNTPSSRETYIQVQGVKLPLVFGRYEVKTILYKNGALEESYELLI